MGFFKKDELKLLWPFYIDAILISILYITPAFYVLYFKGIGLSLFQIGLLMSVSSLAGLVFEIPTGAVADLFGRKFSTLLGYILAGGVFIAFYFTNNFSVILLLYFLLGFSITFTSGAYDAWIIDLLRAKKKKELIQEYHSKYYSFSSFGLLIGGLLGAFLVKLFGLSIIWPVTGGAFILSAFISMFGEEYFIRKKQGARKYLKEFFSHTKKSIKYSIKNETIFLFLMITVFMSFVYAFSGEITWFPFLQGIGFKDHWFGYLFSAAMVIGIFAPYLIKPLMKVTGKYKYYFITILGVMTLSTFLIGFIGILIPAVLIFLLFSSTWDFYTPSITPFFHLFVPGKMRATIESFKEMILALFTIISFPIAGYLADKIGPQMTIFITAFILIPVVILYSKIDENKKRLK